MYIRLAGRIVGAAGDLRSSLFSSGVGPEECATWCKLGNEGHRVSGRRVCTRPRTSAQKARSARGRAAHELGSRTATPTSRRRQASAYVPSSVLGVLRCLSIALETRLTCRRTLNSTQPTRVPDDGATGRRCGAPIGWADFPGGHVREGMGHVLEGVLREPWGKVQADCQIGSQGESTDRSDEC